MKVLYIIDTLEGYGAEKSLVEIAVNLTNIEPVFVQVYKGDMLRSKLEDKGIKVYLLNLNAKYGFREAVKKLIPIYLHENPAIVHATLFRSEIVARSLKRKFPQICLVGSFVSNTYSKARFLDKNFLYKAKLYYFHLLNKRSVKRVDYFISNSQTIKERNANALEIPLEKIKVIYRGRDIKQFQLELDQNSANKKPRKLLNVSRLIPLKGQMDLLKSIALIKGELPDIKLRFAGHGSYLHTLKREVIKLSLQDNVEFLGRVDDIPGVLNEADLFVYPSYSEGLPGALIEAMMAGKIIIASNIPENLECVNDHSALIFEKGNIEELASQIKEVLLKWSDFQFLGRNARFQAIERFEIKNIVDQYQNAYDSFLK
ncbi:glycosyltransferase family 4 protein [Christiangramia sp.]|uniref:glycosyltransferase family 4 protein n=1 Tax=Christiangramia sp. TaxID=1931228 RepID=UPI00260EECA4|nr:glycosyltransferase family 4 protein [Christiangramia sp.]